MEQRLIEILWWLVIIIIIIIIIIIAHKVNIAVWHTLSNR